MADTDFAIVVGITRYPAIGSLQGPENDARDFADWLRSPNGGAVPENHIACVLSSQFAETADMIRAKPTQDDVLVEFDQLIEQSLERDGRLGRRLYIYMAGHGISQNIEEVALLMANASQARRHHIPGRHYATYFRTAAFFEEVVLLMDCCRDDFPRVPIFVPAWPDIRRAGAEVRYFFGFATKWSRKAREKEVEPGGPVRGIFTRTILEAFENATPDDTGRITGAAVEDYVFNRLPALLDADEYQEPRFEFDNRSDIVFVEPSGGFESGIIDEAPVKIHFDSTMHGARAEILDHSFEQIEEREAGPEVWETQLPDGLYLLQVPEKQKRMTLEIIGGKVLGQEGNNVNFG